MYLYYHKKTIIEAYVEPCIKYASENFLFKCLEKKLKIVIENDKCLYI